MLSANGPIFPIRLTLRLFAAAFASTADIPMPTIFCWLALLVKADDNVLNAPLKSAAWIFFRTPGAFAALAKASPAPSSTRFTPIVLDLRLVLLRLRTTIFFPCAPSIAMSGPPKFFSRYLSAL